MAVEESFKNIWKKVLSFNDGYLLMMNVVVFWVMFTVDKLCSNNIIVCSVRVVYESELMQDFLNIRDRKKALLVCISHILIEYVVCITMSVGFVAATSS